MRWIFVRFDLQKTQAVWRAVKVFARRRWLIFSRPAAMFFEVPYGHVLAAAGRGLREALYLVTPARAAGGQQNSYSLRKYRIIGWWYGEVNFSQAWPANFAGLLGSSARKSVQWTDFSENGLASPRRQVKEFAGCGWLKVIRQAAAHIVRYFLNCH